MGGSLFLTKISYCQSMEYYGYDEEEEAKKAATATKEEDTEGKDATTKTDDEATEAKDASDSEMGEEEDEFPSFEYSYRGWPWMKGEFLQGSLNYLKSLKKQLDDEPTQFTRVMLLEDKGINAVFYTTSDEDAREATKKAIPGALKVIKGWTRSQTGRDMFSGGNPFGFGGRSGGAGGLFGGMGGGPGFGLPNLATLTDAPYDMDKLNTLMCCPIEVERVGLRGLYHFLRLPDNNIQSLPMKHN